jgi:tRNA-(ms[2]io[6]A)-hydroxylase
VISLAPTSASWVAAALADLDTLLTDHAHCERKAAATALRFIARHAERPRFVGPLSRLAREELVHLERVLVELKARGVSFRPLHAAGYATELFRAAEGPAEELLCCALIEARSHERFARLAEAVTDPRLRALYVELGEAEARHGELYVDLARDLQPDVDPALARLCAAEATIIARPGQPVRMHAGG